MTDDILLERIKQLEAEVKRLRRPRAPHVRKWLAKHWADAAWAGAGLALLWWVFGGFPTNNFYVDVEGSWRPSCHSGMAAIYREYILGKDALVSCHWRRDLFGQLRDVRRIHEQRQ